MLDESRQSTNAVTGWMQVKYAPLASGRRHSWMKGAMDETPGRTQPLRKRIPAAAGTSIALHRLGRRPVVSKQFMFAVLVRRDIASTEVLAAADATAAKTMAGVALSQQAAAPREFEDICIQQNTRWTSGLSPTLQEKKRYVLPLNPATEGLGTRPETRRPLCRSACGHLPVREQVPVSVGLRSSKVET